jgi:hypothetical protein
MAQIRHQYRLPPLLARLIQRQGGRPNLIGLIGRVHAVAGSIYASADGCRVYVKLPARATLAARLVMPATFQPVRRKA